MQVNILLKGTTAVSYLEIELVTFRLQEKFLTRHTTLPA
uniref:Uncharacterized protein n=1 Tax=Anguilla anguilla TaxID=7936 RepID=A0A0E9XBE6_ANGAN